MPKIKKYQVTDAGDANKAKAGIEKVLKTLGINDYLKVKPINLAWLQANAADGKFDVELTSDLKPTTKGGSLKCVAKAGGQTSVLGVYNVTQEAFDNINETLKKAGLV